MYIAALIPPLHIHANHPHRTETLRNVEVWAARPMRDIGVQKTAFDSAALKENAALSMADILTFNSSVFVKNHGRATLSTVAFRGTSPSHTQVTWNGMRINSPMLGMTDFSSIPAFFVDAASLMHGTSSVNEAGGGLGGAVCLSTTPSLEKGTQFNYVQGIGSFSTFDEFVRFSHSSEKWSLSTRTMLSSSPNDYKYTNHDKKLNLYDDNHNIIAQYHPTERNRSGAYRDMHFLQEVYFRPSSQNNFGLNLWFTNSNRELPLLTTDYSSGTAFENRQRETTLRALASFRHSSSLAAVDLRAGYIHTHLGYDYKRELAPEIWATMTHSRSNLNTFFAQLKTDISPSARWLFTLNVSAHQHFVRSVDDNVVSNVGQFAIVGYDQGRIELSALASAKWKPTHRLGLSAVLRQEMFGSRWAPPIPAFFFDALVSHRANVLLKASVSRNHRFPTLNDLYFLPGGNPNLKSEHGWTYDAGLSFSHSFKDNFPLSIDGSATWFESRIDDWILWLPTTKGFFSPQNVKSVHAHGVEASLRTEASPWNNWLFSLSGSYSWTPSVNCGEKMSEADRSVGRQLPYVPLHSSSLIGRAQWKGWGFLYKWAYYSQRFTMSSNDVSLTGSLPPYFMSNIALTRNQNTRFAALQFKLAVNNIFNEDYLSVLSHPMPGINFEFFVSLTPKWKK